MIARATGEKELIYGIAPDIYIAFDVDVAASGERRAAGSASARGAGLTGLQRAAAYLPSVKFADIFNSQPITH